MTVAATFSPVFCVIDGLHRDLTVADDAVEGRFTHSGSTLDLSRTPNWLDQACSDEEWRIEWVKLYEGLDLADAFATTGDVRYLTTWEDLVDSFCAQVPVGHDSSDVSARRVQNWLYAWQRFAGSPGFSGLRGDLADRLRRRIVEDTDHLAEHLTAARNHRTLEVYTLFLVGLATRDDARTREGLGLLAENAATDIGPDGVHCERSTDYHGIVLRSLVGAIVNARKADVAVPPALIEAVDRAATVAMHWQRPDGITPAVSDADQADFRPLLRLASRVLGRADLLWASSGGASGIPPNDDHLTFPDGGYVVQRSGWGVGTRTFEREWWALFDVGPLGEGGHGHYDHLSVELFAEGRPIAVDPGRYTYAEGPDGLRRWFKGTAAHNTVQVDGLDQTPYRRGKPKGTTSSAALLGRETTATDDIVVGRAHSPCYDAVHTREVRFRRDDCWVVRDHLRAPGRHVYQLRWHLPATASGAVTLTGGGDRVNLSTPDAVISVEAGASALGAGLARPVRASIEPGWVSPRYGVKHRAPVMVVEVEGDDVDFTTTVRPRGVS